MRRRFNTCLNMEAKAFNFSMCGLVFGGVGLIFGMCFVGLLTGLFGAAISFAVGAVIGRKLHNGSLQRDCYWLLPISGYFVSRNLPKSHICFYH